jgi:membrane protein implicated in regulation of membrane protease activity
MSPTGGRRTTSATLLPFVAALCALIIVREGLQWLLPSLSYWVVFVVSLVVGLLAYSAVERYLARRGPNGQGKSR